MDASARGAKEAGGLTVGILPDPDLRHVSDYIDIPILTDLGSGRNNINVLTSDVIIACRGGAGTLSEVALAVKAGKKVILMDFDVSNLFDETERAQLILVNTPEEAIEIVKNLELTERVLTRLHETTRISHNQDNKSLEIFDGSLIPQLLRPSFRCVL